MALQLRTRATTPADPAAQPTDSAVSTAPDIGANTPRKTTGVRADKSAEKPRLHLETHPDLKRLFMVPGDVQRIEKITYQSALQRLFKLRRALGKPRFQKVTVAEYAAHYGYQLAELIPFIPEKPLKY